MIARAVGTIRDAELDDEVLDFGGDLFVACGRDYGAPRFKLYFSIPPSKFVRIGKRAEAAKVKSWDARVRSEPENSLKQHADALRDKSAASLAAQDALDVADGETKTASVRDWQTYTEALDARREQLHADIVKLGERAQKQRGYADRFFLVKSRRSRANDAGGAPSGGSGPSGGPLLGGPSGATPPAAPSAGGHG